MEKLVITYYSGSEYERQDVNVCLEYKSAEKFVVDFEKIANEMYVKGNIAKDKYKEVTDKIYSSNEYKNYLAHPNHKKFIKEYLDFEDTFKDQAKDFDSYRYDYFEFAGTKWETSEIYEKNGLKITIQTLNEWFESHKGSQ